MKPPMRIADKPAHSTTNEKSSSTKQPRSRASEKFQALKGTIRLQLDVNELRGRSRR